MWLFLVLFVISLFAEFIANDKPLYHALTTASRYFPVLLHLSGNRPSAATSRPPPTTAIRYLQKLIADKDGSDDLAADPLSPTTPINLDLPTPAPSQADLDADAKRNASRWPPTQGHCKAAATLEYNWLGTDDQGRDVLARLIYGFRISVLFGLILTIVSSVIGVAAGAVQGYFGGWTDLLFQRFIEIWTSVPELYLLLIISSVLVPGFFVLLGILLLFSWVRLVGLVRAEFLRGRNFEYIQAARALGVSNAVIMFRHLLPNAMVATHDVPAVHHVVVGDDADRARLPRLRPAARLALARRVAVAGQGQCAGAVARAHRLLSPSR